MAYSNKKKKNRNAALRSKNKNKNKKKSKSNKKNNNNSSSATAAAKTKQPVPEFRDWTEEDVRSRHGEGWGINKYPMSKYFLIGYNLRADGKKDESHSEFLKGVELDSCVWCMLSYAECQVQDYGNFHNAYPYFLEGAIRGNDSCTVFLLDLYNSEKSHTVTGLQNFWTKIAIRQDSDYWTEEERIAYRNELRNRCGYCQKENVLYEEKNLCEGCRCYSYCCKECQRKDWIDRNHRGECRQLKILKKYFKNYANEIRILITSGVDPKTIEPLQTLRTKLGLNRPRDEYEHIMKLLDNDEDDDTKKEGTREDTKGLNRCEYLSGRPKDGTVYIGSTPNVI